jgi:hypothetical protein
MVSKEVTKWIGKSTGRLGVSSLGSIEEEITKWDPLLFREFRWPMKVKANINNGPEERLFGIWRIFFGFKEGKEEEGKEEEGKEGGGWEVIGGFLNVGRSVKIHGGRSNYSVLLPI